MVTIDQQLHDVVMSIANYRERKLLEAGETASATNAALRRLRGQSKVLGVALILALTGSILGPFAATYSAPTSAFPPLAVVGYVIPPLCILYSRQCVTHHVTRIETLLSAVPN